MVTDYEIFQHPNDFHYEDALYAKGKKHNSHYIPFQSSLNPIFLGGGGSVKKNVFIFFIDVHCRDLPDFSIEMRVR